MEKRKRHSSISKSSPAGAFTLQGNAHSLLSEWATLPYAVEQQMQKSIKKKQHVMKLGMVPEVHGLPCAVPLQMLPKKNVA